MKRVLLRARVYGPLQRQLLASLRPVVRGMLSDLDLQRVNLTAERRRGRLVVEVHGTDEEFAANLIVTEFGTTIPFDSVRVDDLYPGQLVDVGKIGYGVYVDIGIDAQPRVDALVPLYRVRRQLGIGRESIRRISSAFALVENLPVEVHIDDINPSTSSIGAAFSERFVSRLLSWSSDDHERLLILGAPLSLIEETLRRTHHTTDVYKTERLGQFEFTLVCKRSTHASGLLAAIGPHIPVPIHLFLPHKAQELLLHET